MTNQYTPLESRFSGSISPEPNSGCWLWVGSTSKTKNDIRPYIQNKGKRMLAYRLSYEMHVGPIPVGAMICHKCGVSICVNPEHLYAGNAKTNAADSFRHGRRPSREFLVANAATLIASRKAATGLPGPRLASIIPHSEVPRLRRRLAAGETLASLGAEYGLTKQGVRGFILREERRAALAATKGEKA